MVSFDNLYNYKASSLYYVCRLWPKDDNKSSLKYHITFLLIWLQFADQVGVGELKHSYTAVMNF